MQQLITTLHIIVCILLVILVLIQRGKGSEMGAGFGGGASNTMFGSQGVTPFLVKLTAGLALVFFLSSAVLSFVVSKYAAANVEGLPFVAAPMKAVQPIPVSSEVQQTAAEKSVAAPAPASTSTSVSTPAPAPVSAPVVSTPAPKKAVAPAPAKPAPATSTPVKKAATTTHKSTTTKKESTTTKSTHHKEPVKSRSD